MQYWSFQLPNGTQVMTCPAALGYSFGAGTTDGAGEEGFMQSDDGKPDANPFWQMVSPALRNPSDRQKACHGAKPILLDVGEMTWPYAWTANIVDISVFRVGQLFIVISPAEATTMAGRRWREAIATAATGLVDTKPIVVLGGPGNTYCHYAVTPEEYTVQRYEGASTLHGPHTLDAYINLTVSALPYLAPTSTTQPPKGPQPPDSRSQSTSFLTDVVFDVAPIGKKIGACTKQPAATSFKVGATVSATFQGASPRNNLRLEGTYAAVDQLVDGQWKRVRSDYDWFLVFEWTRTNVVLGWSDVRISWETADDNVQPGTYRLHYYGDLKAFGTGKVHAFEGVSNSFAITA
jgi:neutral ceramidase